MVIQRKVVKYGWVFVRVSFYLFYFFKPLAIQCIILHVFALDKLFIVQHRFSLLNISLSFIYSGNCPNGMLMNLKQEVLKYIIVELNIITLFSRKVCAFFGQGGLSGKQTLS